ncbi:MAG: UbiA family prenyltransferase [Planctomycetota bacterium]
MRAWLQFIRVGLLPTAISNVAIGIALTQPAPDSPLRVAGVLGLGALLYAFGMGLNDAIDHSIDETKHPDRPLPSGRLSRRLAVGSLGALLLAVAAIAALLGPVALMITASAVVCIAIYDGGAKDHPLLGPLSMGSVRACLPLLGAAGVGASPWQAPVLLAATGLLGYVALLTAHSRTEDDARRWNPRKVLVGWVGAWAGAALVAADAPSFPFLGATAWTFTLGWVVRCNLASTGSKPRPFLTTLGLLQGLFALDLAMALTYDRPTWAAVSAGLALSTVLTRRS